MKEEHKISPNMEKFFDNLLKIKEFVNSKYKESKDPVLKEIHEKLDKVVN